MLDYLFKNGRIIDGKGEPAYEANLGIENGKITYIGAEEPEAKETLEIAGRYIAPGFIDMHSHGDYTLPVYRQAESAAGQGITTIVGGNCGMSPSPCPSFYSQFPFEERAVAKVLPPPIGGINPGFVQVVPTELLRPAYNEEFGEDLDWKSFGEYVKHVEQGIGVNLVALAGHGQIRLQVLGCDNCRPSTESEIEQIAALCEQCMEEGAAGISLGLDYEPGSYADEKELEAVASCVASKGKIMTVHYQMRPVRRGKTNPAHRPLDGIREMLELALKTGVHMHLSHVYQVFASACASREEEIRLTHELLCDIEDYRSRGAWITYDTLVSYTGGDYFYPQVAQRFQPYVVQAGGMQAFSDALKIGNYKEMIAADIKRGAHPSASVMTSLNPVQCPEWGQNFIITSCTDETAVGKTLGQLCKEKGKSYVDVMLDLLESDPYTCYNMWNGASTTPESEVYLQKEDMAVGLDVSPVNYDSIRPFPEGDYPENRKSTGTYCGYVKYLLTDIESLEKRIAHMTGIPAQILGLSDRGIIREGNAADLVVFDMKRLETCEDFLYPASQPKGIDYVLVNGKPALWEGKLTDELNGVFISD